MVLGVVLGANHEPLSAALAKRLIQGRQPNAVTVDGRQDRSLRLGSTEEELEAIVLGASPEDLAAALGERLKRGQQRHEEFWELQCKLTGDTMTRDSYSLADLMSHLESRLAEGQACGLCQPLVRQEQIKACKTCADAIEAYCRDEVGSFDEMYKTEREHPNHTVTVKN